MGDCEGGYGDRVIRSPGLGSASRCSPGFRVTLDDVKRRLRPILVPRARQARDGSQYGGTQSTDISRINRRSYWLRLDAGPGVFNDRHQEKEAYREMLSAQHLGSLDKPKSYQRRCITSGASPTRAPSGACIVIRLPKVEPESPSQDKTTLASALVRQTPRPARAEETRAFHNPSDSGSVWHRKTPT